MLFKYFKKLPVNKVMGIIFVIIIPIIVHILFSKLGFNPTDDGFILAGARRILDGQVPHLDFISIRPAGSYYLYAPLVYLGGDYVVWISRYLVWLQFACINWVWVIIIDYVFKSFQSPSKKFTVALIAFFFSAHYFPIMAWHTLDALFFSSLGILLIVKPFKFNLAKFLGYLLLGLSPLFRQNFLFIIPFALFILDDWRKLKYLVASITSAIIYILYLTLNSVFNGAIVQLVSYSSNTMIQAGLISYLTSTPFLGILLGFVVSILYSAFNLKSGRINYYKISSTITVFGILIVIASSISFPNRTFTNYSSYIILGIVFGFIIAFIYKDRKMNNHTIAGILVLIMAWCTSLSIGYASPALATGPLFLYIIGCLIYMYRIYPIENFKFINLNSIHSRYMMILLILLLITSAFSFSWARETHIYREISGNDLNYNLDNLSGMKLIKTNYNNFVMLKDLNNAQILVKEKGKRYAIIPDCAFIWIKSPQSNPLTIDWPQDIELNNPKVCNCLIEDINSQKGNVIFIVQKYEFSEIYRRFKPLESYKIVTYIHKNFQKIGETEYFELYEYPS